MSKTITVNGTERPIPSDPRVSLLDFLRENEGLTGTKKGCDHGQCGACTVIVNGPERPDALLTMVLHEGDLLGGRQRRGLLGRGGHVFVPPAISRVLAKTHLDAIRHSARLT